MSTCTSIKYLAGWYIVAVIMSIAFLVLMAYFNAIEWSENTGITSKDHPWLGSLSESAGFIIMSGFWFVPLSAIVYMIC